MTISTYKLAIDLPSLRVMATMVDNSSFFETPIRGAIGDDQSIILRATGRVHINELAPDEADSSAVCLKGDIAWGNGFISFQRSIQIGAGPQRGAVVNIDRPIMVD